MGHSLLTNVHYLKEMSFLAFQTSQVLHCDFQTLASLIIYTRFSKTELAIVEPLSAVVMNPVSAQRPFTSLKPQTGRAVLQEYVIPPTAFCFVSFACCEPLPFPALNAECAIPASDASSFLSLSAPHFRPYNFPAACVLWTFCGEFQLISGCSAVATSVCVSVASHPLWPCVQVNSSHSG